MRRMSNARADCGGFTLLELLVVVTIMGFLIAFAPRLSAAVRPGGEATAREVVAALRAARGEAIRVAAPRGVTFDLDAHAIETHRGVYEWPSDVALRVEAAEETSAARRPTIVFFPDGGATGGRVWVIESGQRREDVVAEIGVRWLTGAVRRTP